MSRLTERYKEKVFCKADCSEMIDYAEDCECPHLQKIKEKLAHYEDLEEQGLLLKLKPIKGFEEYYAIDAFGCVYGIAKDNGNGRRVLKRKTTVAKCGYMYITLKANGVVKNARVHRLVAEAFIPNPNNLPEVNHIDGDKLNNNVWNLEWCSKSQNIKHATDNNLNIPPTNCVDGVWMNGKNKYVVITNTITNQSVLYTSIKQACEDIGRGHNYIYEYIKKGIYKFNSREYLIQVFLTKSEAEKALSEMEK